jgi:gamma-glutamylaminecyclotransferase
MTLFRSEPTARVFVYGTLLVGESNHHYLAEARLVREAKTRPAFRLYDLGTHPGLVAGGEYAVSGEVYEVDATTLAALDQLEEHPDVYRRTHIVLDDGTELETYLMPPELVAGHPVIASGSWRARSKAATR